MNGKKNWTPSPIASMRNLANARSAGALGDERYFGFAQKPQPYSNLIGGRASDGGPT
jgi:hypothetical protein